MSIRACRIDRRPSAFIGGLKVWVRCSLVLILILFTGIHPILMAQRGVPSLELRLSLQDTDKPFPTSFTAILINTGNAPLKLPTPALSCTDSYHGSVELRMTFLPLKERSNPPHYGRGCGGGYFDVPRGADRLDSWKMLKPGEFIKLSGDIHELFHDQGPGT